MVTFADKFECVINYLFSFLEVVRQLDWLITIKNFLFV